MELRNFYRISILRIPLLRYRQRSDFLLQHYHDDALDNSHFRINLRLARCVLAFP
jgi:hypothetical protein